MPAGRGRLRSDADLVPDAGALVIEPAFNLTCRPGFSQFTGPDDSLAKDRHRCSRSQVLRMPLPPQKGVLGNRVMKVARSAPASFTRRLLGLG
jgi:hypothetical protein